MLYVALLGEMWGIENQMDNEVETEGSWGYASEMDTRGL